MSTNLLLTILCHLILGSTKFSIGIDDEHYEGDQCTLENGKQGICKKLPECRSRLNEVQAGIRASDSEGRCGFDNFTEIVCCPVNVTEKIGRRPAEVACQQYDNKVTINSRLQSNLSFHIFDGVQADVGEFPYMVALGYTNTTTGAEPRIKYACGGSLISDEHVLTAAHCVNNKQEALPVVVHLGNVNINSSRGAQRIAISDIISHPQYRRGTYYNDVAILKLKFKVQVSGTVKPICLQTKSIATIDITPRTSLVVIGWGSTNDDDFKPSDHLMRTPSLSLVNTEECDKSYRNYPNKLPRGIDSSMICAKDANESRMADACEGDSGGPLLMLTDSGASVIGITAFGQMCGTVVPGVYTAVYTFLDWIEEQVWPRGAKPSLFG